VKRQSKWLHGAACITCHAITVLSGMVQQNFGMCEKARVSATISYFPVQVASFKNLTL
jgi:cytochrome c peroxidase